MPRQARIVVPDIPHHITQRGNYQQIIFEGDNDYRRYMQWLNEYSRKYRLDLIAFCLMSNHVHIIAIPRNEESLSRTLNTLHMRYAQYINRKRKIFGHLWQGRFFSCLLDETHLYRAIRYVENNPVRAAIVKRAWEYKWSSAAYHVEKDSDLIIKTKMAFNMKPEDWKDYLTEDDKETEREMRLKTQKGLAVGTDKFITYIEAKIKRSLKCLDRGRPCKQI